MIVWQTPTNETCSALTIYISTGEGGATHLLLCHTLYAGEVKLSIIIEVYTTFASQT